VVEDGGDHPVAGRAFVSAADQVRVIFAGAGAENRIPATSNACFVQPYRRCRSWFSSCMVSGW
jgi:hypothetical protein